ncbi:hypothetical protein [Candidatus Igneacidithiobacillus taiwanensis]|nr:hypothetical protein [Candidatus Igneacidithiobacillus taiwanensis]
MGKPDQKEQSKAQAAQRQRQGEIVRVILDPWATTRWRAIQKGLTP